MLGRALLVLVLCSIAWVADLSAPAIQRATTEGLAWQADSSADDDADARLIAAHRTNAALSDSSPRVADARTQGLPTIAPAVVTPRRAAPHPDHHPSAVSHLLHIPLLI